MSVSLDWAVTRRGMRYPALQMALERHLTWARGFALPSSQPAASKPPKCARETSTGALPS